MVDVTLRAVAAQVVRRSDRVVVRQCYTVPAVDVSLSYRPVLTIVVSGILVLFCRAYVVAFVVASGHTSLVTVIYVILIDCI